MEESSFARMLIQRGRVEGVEEGRVVQAVRTLLRLIKRRSQHLDESLIARIEAITDIEFLHQLLDLAIDGTSLDLLQSEILKYSA